MTEELSTDLSTDLPEGSVVMFHEGIAYPVPYQRIGNRWTDGGGSRPDSDIAKALASDRAEIVYHGPDPRERLARMLYERIETPITGIGWISAPLTTRATYWEIAEDVIEGWGK